VLFPAICILSENDKTPENNVYASIKFCFKLDKTATETYEILKVDVGKEQ
jgi:hypothetical protein